MKDYYSSIAAGYDELHGAEQDAKLQEFLDRLNALRVGIAHNARLLDAGCGTGRSYAILSKPPVNADWYGIEPAKGLIMQAPKAAQERIALGPGEELPWADESFDLVLSLTALQNYDDPARGVREMARVVKREGVVLISFLKKSPKRDALDLIIRTSLDVIDAWEQGKDLMYICRKQS